MSFSQYLHKDEQGNVVDGLPLYVYTHGNTRGGTDIELDRLSPLRSANGAIALMQRMQDDPAYASHIIVLQYTGMYPFMGETAYIRGYIDALIEDGSVDADRVYAAGFSLGAQYTNTLVNGNPGLFAAAMTMAPVSGYPDNANKRANAKMAYWMFVNEYNGEPYVGGLNGFVANGMPLYYNARATLYKNSNDPFVWPYNQWGKTAVPLTDVAGHEMEAAVLYNNLDASAADKNPGTDGEWNSEPTAQSAELGTWEDDYADVFEWMFDQSLATNDGKDFFTVKVDGEWYDDYEWGEAVTLTPEPEPEPEPEPGPGPAPAPTPTPPQAGDSVEITATVPDDKLFVKWEIAPTEGLVFEEGSSATSNPATFTMPDNDVTVEVVFINLYTVTVDGVELGEYYEEGDSVTITATVPSGKRFVKWNITSTAELVFTDGSATSATAVFTMPDNDVTVTAVVEDIPSPAPSGGSTSGGGGAASGGTTAAEAAAEPETVTALPEAAVTAPAASAETETKAETAVASAAQAAVGTGASVTAAGPAVTVAGAADTAKVTTLTLPEAVNADAITTMAVLNDDGTLTPVPTVVNADGTVTALVTGSATLVPLNVEAGFTDLNYTPEYAYVAEEINKAAGLMIVEGRGDGVFDPNAQVTTQESVTMFLRAAGVPVEYSTAMTTGASHGFNSAGAVPSAPMTRIDTAALIVNALKDTGLKPSMSAAKANSILAKYTDLAGLTEAQRIDLAICVELNIFRGYGNSTLMGPEDVLLRSHMASLSVRLQSVILRK
jgi:hypothetical protein